MISIEVDTKPDSDWNKRLLQSGFGSVYQSQERAALLEMENVSNLHLITLSFMELLKQEK